MATNNQILLAQSRKKDINIKINLLNKSRQTVAEISGVTINNPTFSNDATSDIRRTCNVTFIPVDSTFDIAKGNKIWIDKYVQVLYGEKNLQMSDYTWTNMGMYLLDNPEQTYDATTNTITLKCIDFMANLNGLRNGVMSGGIWEIKQGDDLESYILQLLALFEMSSGAVISLTTVTYAQYDIKGNIGSTVYDMLQKIMEMTPNFQMYFDVDGHFHYEPIPTGDNEQVMVDDTIWQNNLVSYNKNTDFESVKNYIEVWGKTHDVDYYASTVTYDASVSVYQLTVDKLLSTGTPATLTDSTFTMTDTDVTSLVDGQTVVRLYTQNASSSFINMPMLKVNDFDAYPIEYNLDGIDNNFPIRPDGEYYDLVYKASATNTSTPVWSVIDGYLIGFNTPVLTGTRALCTTPQILINGYANIDFDYANGYPLQQEDGYPIIENNGKFYCFILYRTQHPVTDGRYHGYCKFLGGLQAYGTAYDIVTSSPFNWNSIGRVNRVCSGGEYENINSDYLAKQRAKYELYNYDRLQDKISITCVPIPWLDVNWLMQITLPNKNGNETTDKYLIKNISTTLGVDGLQTIECMKYYPNWS